MFLRSSMVLFPFSLGILYHALGGVAPPLRPLVLVSARSACHVQIVRHLHGMSASLMSFRTVDPTELLEDTTRRRESKTLQVSFIDYPNWN